MSLVSSSVCLLSVCCLSVCCLSVCCLSVCLSVRLSAVRLSAVRLSVCCLSVGLSVCCLSVYCPSAVCLLSVRRSVRRCMLSVCLSFSVMQQSGAKPRAVRFCADLNFFCKKHLTTLCNVAYNQSRQQRRCATSLYYTTMQSIEKRGHYE